MDTGIDSSMLSVYQAATEANAKIAILRRVTMDSKDTVPVKMICQIFDWRVPEVKRRAKPSASKVCELFKNGRKPKQIAEAYGMNEMEVREILRSMGLIDQGTTI